MPPLQMLYTFLQMLLCKSPLNFPLSLYFFLFLQVPLLGRPGWAFSKDGDFSNEKWQKVDSGKPGVNLMVSLTWFCIQFWELITFSFFRWKFWRMEEYWPTVSQWHQVVSTTWRIIFNHLNFSRQGKLWEEWLVPPGNESNCTQTIGWF